MRACTLSLSLRSLSPHFAATAAPKTHTIATRAVHVVHCTLCAVRDVRACVFACAIAKTSVPRSPSHPLSLSLLLFPASPSIIRHPSSLFPSLSLTRLLSLSSVTETHGESRKESVNKKCVCKAGVGGGGEGGEGGTLRRKERHFPTEKAGKYTHTHMQRNWKNGQNRLQKDVLFEAQTQTHRHAP